MIAIHTIACTEIPADQASPILLSGRVVDSRGIPVAGAIVSIGQREAEASPVTTIVSDGDGRFSTSIVTTPAAVESMHIDCKSADNLQIGYLALRTADENLDWQSLEVQIDVAKQARLVVLDAQEKPISGASVAALLGNLGGRRITTITDESGLAELTYTSSEPIAVALAWKDGEGLDYRLYQQAQRGYGPEFPEDSIERFKLEGTAPVTLRIVDDQQRPLEGIRVYPFVLQKTVRTATSSTDLNLSFFHDFIHEYSDANGEVTFKWMPTWQKSLISFWASAEHGVVRARVYHDPGLGKGISQVELERTVPIRGTVFGLDGRPAKGITISAHGIGYSYDRCKATAETDDSGNYELQVAPSQVYMLIVKDSQWASSPQSGFAVFRNTPVEGKDFSLRKATRIVVTVRSTAPPQVPVPACRMSLTQSGIGISELSDIQLSKPTISIDWPPGPTSRRNVSKPGLMSRGVAHSM